MKKTKGTTEAKSDDLQIEQVEYVVLTLLDEVSTIDDIKKALSKLQSGQKLIIQEFDPETTQE